MSKSEKLSSQFENSSTGKREPNAAQALVKDASMWLDLFFSMLFDPEDFHLKRAVYGVGTNSWNSVGEDIKARVKALEEANQRLLHMPEGPEKNAARQDIISNQLLGTPLLAQTLLRPDLLEAASQDERNLAVLKDIIDQVDAYNKSIEGTAAIQMDAHLVANWIWDESGPALHTKSPEDIKTALESLTAATEQTRNAYLGLALIKGGASFDANNDGDYDDIGDRKSILQKIADKEGVTIDEINIPEHMGDIKAAHFGIYENILTNNSAYWDESEKTKSIELTAKILGYEPEENTRDSLKKAPLPEATAPASP